MPTSAILREAITVPGFAVPTMGGKQFWRDTYVHAGWRLQKNVRTGRHRLLDPKNGKRACGDFERCRARFEEFRSTRGIAPPSDHLVLLVHGIARSAGTFGALQGSLRRAGYDATAISYPSTRASIDEHAAGVAALLDRLEGTHTVSFVTHSMGALLLRCLLATKRPWMRTRAVGRIVLIAPPNQGSAVASFLKDNRLYKVLYGPAGQQLVPEFVKRMPGLYDRQFAIVAGGRGGGRGFNPLLTGDNDGTVRVAETALDGSLGTLVVPQIHARIANHPDTVRATTEFIDNGRITENFKSERPRAGASRSK
jgi:pimeloyl-ACP methyl ester carboxylesterase